MGGENFLQNPPKKNFSPFLITFWVRSSTQNWNYLLILFLSESLAWGVEEVQGKKECNELGELVNIVISVFKLNEVNSTAVILREM